MRRHWFIAAALVAASASTGALAQSPADQQLKALYDAEWQWRVSENMARGEGPPNPHMPHVDAASQARRAAYWSDALKKLDALPLDQLSPEERINAEVFREALQGFLTEYRFKEYEDAFGFWTWMAPNYGFGSVEGYKAYLSRLSEMPRYVDEQIANMRAGIKRGFTRSAIAVKGREKAVEPLASTDATANPLYQPFTMMPASIPADQVAPLQAQGKAAVAETSKAFAKLLTFLQTEYMPKARTETSAEALPDGKAYYAAKLRQYTTLDLTPDEIHEIGLKEVARIKADMDRTMKESGWTGDFAGFLHFLKTDPQFYAKTPYELLAKSSYVANKINGELKNTIGLLPRYRFTIRPTPDNIAPFATGGNGGLESCKMNTYNLPARPLYTIPPLTAHECAPGHSFQAALALEGPDRPEIRKNTYFSGYGEGWALYMEWLGTKWGIYETPYDEFGRQTYEMWRATRLVIDTGLHHKGWTRQQAYDYLRNHTALSDHEVTIETDRYITSPGQANAYKLGELLIRRKRAEAEKALGDRFDQRWFHDVILGLGAVPLPTLERVIDEWIADGGKNPNPDLVAN
ncbi:conserved hypothetical protein [Sphingobium sp. SYK-6]|uniref:DUF885 domain-containing protein n=1 Tax=Sphingobium sp. (strain NBRC 103272 / SYK-6) TaxID=627192 RepID=UPI000227770F|nr:DUF885 family protein [Sphingobium sp. SYK-6]BAK67264.1 conserved hypothetical protein [Sphingobium sp. SYK-6]